MRLVSSSVSELNFASVNLNCSFLPTALMVQVQQSVSRVSVRTSKMISDLYLARWFNVQLDAVYVKFDDQGHT